ncbi:actinidain [Selaginella moellendorffii]|uniref:actinidain n=1 Tax=Selaginella moellendorffii TaxID=88036 RepID=UPI000D1C5A89|nr:actinidain [Selaginella moellendorffii]|eukprot:XP_024537799.1 actinidain [Selaginella moellendorffii]
MPGGFPEDAFKFVVENGGVTTEEAYPYTGFAGSCNANKGILSGQCGNSRDHAVLVIGYGTEGGMPYWIIKNSWGTSWGEDGFMKIKKKDGEGMLDPELGIATASRSRESCRLAAANSHD